MGFSLNSENDDTDGKPHFYFLKLNLGALALDRLRGKKLVAFKSAFVKVVQTKSAFCTNGRISSYCGQKSILLLFTLWCS